MNPRRTKLVAYTLLAATVLVIAPPRARGGWVPLLRAPSVYGVRPVAGFNRGSIPLCIGSGDFNGDGLLDLTVGNSTNGGGISVLLNTAVSGYPTAFSAGAEYPNQRAYSLAVAQLNVDSRADIVTTDPIGIAYFLSSGNGFTLTRRAQPTYLDEPRRVAMGDMDGDGPWEAATLSWTFFSTKFQVSVAHGPITDTSQPYDSVLSFPTWANKVGGFKLVDMTGDGKRDVVATYRDSLSQFSKLVILANYSTATGFGTVLQIPSVPEYGLGELDVAFLNGDSIPDVAVANHFGPGQVTIFIGTGGGAFLPPSYVNLDHQPEYICAGDLDGDGKEDLVTVSRDTDAGMYGTVCVLRGKGDGTFATPAETYDGLPGSGPVILTDADQDGRLDIVSPQEGTNAPSHSIAVLLQDATGGFRTNISSQFGTPLTARAIADFNRDGRPDVAVASGGNVRIGIGAGDGAFSPGTSFAAGPTADMLVAEDTNLDGKADLWVQSGNSVQRYPGLGDGTFGPSGGPGGGPALPGALLSRSVADMNRDGWPDLILGNPFNGTLTVYAQTSPNFFMAMGSVTPSVGLNSMATGDWNRDGSLDVVVAGPGGASTFQGDGVGSFSMVENVLQSGRAYTDVCAGDFDRDGILDLAARENGPSLPLDRGVDVFLGTASGGFSPPKSLGTLEQNGLEIRTWDANLDGNLDLVVPGMCDPGSASYRFANVDCFLGNGAGGFGLRSSYGLGTIDVPAAQARCYVNTGDIDRNGIPDVLTGRLTIDSFLARPPGRGPQLRATVFDPTLNSPDDVAVGDLNRDGVPDEVTASLDVSPGIAVRLGTGIGALGPPTLLSQSWNTHRVRLADLNRDGILDIVASNNGSGLPRVSSMLGVGNGTFGPRTDFYINAGSDFEIGDMNRDGIPDVVTATQDSVRVLLGSGTGTFSPSGAFVISPLYDLALGDVNRDGLLDVICVGNAISIIYGNATGGLGPKTTYGPPITAGRRVCVSDVNRDGFLDILGDHGPNLYVLWGDATASYSSYSWASLSSSPAWDIKVGEAQADGALFVYVARFPQSLDLLSVSPTGNLSTVGTYAIPNTPEKIALTDMNRDGVIDVVSVGSGTSELGVTLNGSSTITGVAAAATPVRRVRLDQNYPNPFNPRTTIRFALPQRSRVRLTIHDVSGRLLSILEDGVMPAGEHSIRWRGVSDEGRPVASGVYFYRLATESGTESKRMVVAK